MLQEVVVVANAEIYFRFPYSVFRSMCPLRVFISKIDTELCCNAFTLLSIQEDF